MTVMTSETAMRLTQKITWIRNANSGFTLMELLITMALAAILMMVAVPSYSTFTKNQRLTSYTNELITSINMARGEAARRGTRVALCRSSDPDAASPTCSGSNNDWSNGWLVYAIGDSRTTTPLVYDSSVDVKIGAGLPQSGVYVKSDSATTHAQTLEFAADGTTTATASFAFCDSRGVSKGKLVKVIGTGRANTTDAATCTP